MVSRRRDDVASALSSASAGFGDDCCPKCFAGLKFSPDGWPACGNGCDLTGWLGERGIVRGEAVDGRGDGGALATALQYCGFGFACFPLQPGSNKPHGRLAPHGFKDASSDPAVIRAWWQAEPRAGLGLPVPPGHVVLDVDGEEGERSLAALEAQVGEPLPAGGPVQRTPGGGRHIWLRTDGRPLKNGQGFRQNLDIRAGGRGYLAIEPSPRDKYNGADYCWEVPLLGTQIPQLSPRWLDALPCDAPPSPVPPAERPASVQAKRRTGQPGTRPDAKRRASAWLAACPPAVQGGNPSGHDRLLWAARGLIGGFGLPRPVAEKLLVDEFNPRCVPPWNLGDPSEARDFFRKLDESERLPFGKPAGWLLDAEPERRNRNGAPSSTASAPATGQGNGAGVALPEIVAIDDLVQRHPALRKPVVHGLLRLGEVGNIVSAPKAGKSWLGYSLAMAVVSGRRWLDTFPTAQGRVLLVDNELDASLLASRLPKVAKAMAVERSVYGPRLDVVHLRGRLCSLDELLPLCETAAERGYSLVILDSLYRFASPGVSENDNTAMACTYNTLNQLAALVDAALVVIHHSSKGSQSEKATTDIGAGGGSQSRAADAHIVLREHDVPGAFTLDAVVRSWPPPQRLAVAWKYPAWRSAPDLNPERIKLPERRDDGRQRKRDSAGRAQLIQVLETSPATVSELRRGTGISKDRAERLLGLLVAEGRVVIEPVVKRGNQTHRYHLVPKDLPGGVDTPNGTNTPPFEGA